MTSKPLNPTLGAKSFSCPSCGALSHQTWYKLYALQFDDNDHPVILRSDAPDRVMEDISVDLETRQSVADYFKRRLTQRPFFEPNEQKWMGSGLENVWVSSCYSCNTLAIWVWDKLISPSSRFVAEPNADLDDEIKLDFHARRDQEPQRVECRRARALYRRQPARADGLV